MLLHLRFNTLYPILLQGGWGTENYIIPLGAGYIEIAAVWDPEAAQSCDWGK